jgi:hypothetical protein
VRRAAVPPVGEKQLREWRKAYGQSQARLLGGAIVGGLGTAAVLGFWLVTLVRLPLWMYLLAVFAVWYQFVGDWMNMLWLRPRIDAAEQDRETSDG